MPRPLLPPRGIFIPTMMIYNREVPPNIVFTWIQLRGLAWDRSETPPISIHQLSDLTGKSQSTLYGHMAVLRSWGALRWRSSEKGTLIVSFPADTGEFYLDGDSLPSDSSFLESENLEKPDPSLSSPYNQSVKFDVKERERENQLDHSRGEHFQKSGKHSRDLENEAPHSGAKSPSGGPDPSLNPVPRTAGSPINQFDLNDVEEREREDNNLDHSRGREIHEFGKRSENLEEFQNSGIDSEYSEVIQYSESPLVGGGKETDLPPELDGADPTRIYKSLTKIRPNQLQRKHLDAMIHDTNIWYACVEHWLSHGWNPKNIQGIIQLYQRGGPSACRYCPQDDEPKEDSLSILKRMRAELQEASNGQP